jgi:hypothetical protein
MATVTAHKRHLGLRRVCIEFLNVDPSHPDYEVHVARVFAVARRLLHAITEEKA